MKKILHGLFFLKSDCFLKAYFTLPFTLTSYLYDKMLLKIRDIKVWKSASVNFANVAEMLFLVSSPSPTESSHAVLLSNTLDES